MKYLSILLGFILLSACEGDTNIISDPENTDQISRHTETSSEVADPLYVDNFQLLDHKGRAHELYYYEDAPAIVIMVQGNGCPIVRNAWTDYSTVRDEYEAQGIPFYMLNANKQDNRDRIITEADNYSYNIPILKDDTQLIAESLNITRTAEVLVISPEDWSIKYRGPVNDRLSYGQQRQSAKHHYLRDALDALLAGNRIETPARKTKGCLVNLPETKKRTEHALISYSDTIAPMLAENCAECHQEGGIGPWAMTDYDMIEGFAPMIREVVRTQRMPPWSADPKVGKFHNERRLSLEEQQTLVHWIEAGAPRGEGPDPLADQTMDRLRRELQTKATGKAPSTPVNPARL